MKSSRTSAGGNNKWREEVSWSGNRLSKEELEKKLGGEEITNYNMWMDGYDTRKTEFQSHSRTLKSS